MEENQSKLDSYIDYINAHILPFIDYNELDRSYRTEKKRMPYDYCYTANIPGEIHISKHRLPEGIKEMLQTFQEHTAELLFEDNKDMDMDR